MSAPAVLTDPGALESPVSGRQIAVEVIDCARADHRALADARRAAAAPGRARDAGARRAGRTGFEDVELGGRPFRMYAAPIAQAGGPAAGGAVLVASDTTDISDTIVAARVRADAQRVGAALLAALAAAALTRRGLRPLRRLARRPRGRSSGPPTRARRLPETDGRRRDRPADRRAQPDARVAGGSRASERRFLADASHELRTPVTALLGNVEYAARHGADAEVLADLQRDAARLARLVDDLLVLERAGARRAGARARSTSTARRAMSPTAALRTANV